VRQHRRPYQDRDDDREDVIGDELAAVNDRLDELTRHIEHLVQMVPGRRHAAGEGDGPSADGVAEALARLDRRLDQVVSDGNATVEEGKRRPSSAPSHGPASWAAQISARQRVLDGEASPQTDLTGLEQQLDHITNQITALQQPYEDGIAALRRDLAEVGRALTESMPSRAVEELEAQVGSLAERIDHGRQPGAEGAALAGVEQGLAEVRDALRGLAPTENLVDFEEAVRGLSGKIDRIGPSDDPAAFKQLEQAVVSLQGVMSNVASEGTVAQLAAEVHGLASGVGRERTETACDALGRVEFGEAMRSLNERIDRMTLDQGDRSALAGLEDRIVRLSEKLDTTDARLGHLEAIERGLADLLVHLDQIRKAGPRELLASPPAEPAAEPAPEPAAEPAPGPAAEPPRPAPDLTLGSPLDLIPAEPVPPAIQSPPSSVVDSALAEPTPTMAEPPVVDAIPIATMAEQTALAADAPTAPLAEAPPEPIVAQALAPVAATPSAAIVPAHAPIAPATPAVIESDRSVARSNGRPRLEPRRPIDPDLPPDTPIEPGSGVPRMRSSSVAARIAASEALLGEMRPAADEPGGKSAAIAAARNALKASYLDKPVRTPKSPESNPISLFTWFKKARNARPLPLPSPAHAAVAEPSAPVAAEPPQHDTLQEPAAGGPSVRVAPDKGVLRHVKTVLVAASVAIIVVAAVQAAFDFLMPSDSVELAATASPEAVAGAEPNLSVPIPHESAETPAARAAEVLGAPNPETTEAIGKQPSFFDPSHLAIPNPAPVDATAALPRPAAAKIGPASPPAASTPQASISALRAGIAAQEPAAEYEMASRYAEGRGVPQDLQEAARWFERAADAGFVPAQFRLAGLNEKGEGLKKDLQAARRLYLSAANKGHAKAMHNLAVLYAEGVEGEPDYKMAAQWFRKAAAYGIRDSQFNLGVLHARGIGVETNLAESYKWFAIAAGQGDQDAATKRDEVAARLDPHNLTAAKLAAQTFIPEREPEDATSLRTPPGGWDRPPAQPTKQRPRTAASPKR
jgi:localization factor PodJL